MGENRKSRKTAQIWDFGPKDKFCKFRFFNRKCPELTSFRKISKKNHQNINVLAIFSQLFSMKEPDTTATDTAHSRPPSNKKKTSANTTSKANARKATNASTSTILQKLNAGLSCVNFTSTESARKATTARTCTPTTPANTST